MKHTVGEARPDVSAMRWQIMPSILDRDFTTTSDNARLGDTKSQCHLNTLWHVIAGIIGKYLVMSRKNCS
jgi:hypothetical protein